MIMDQNIRDKSSQASLETRKKITLLEYVRSELKRGYQLENDEERYAERREKVYTFFLIPRETEKFFAYGFFQCADSFTFVLTFLPVRFILACFTLFSRGFFALFRIGNDRGKILKPAESVDIVKGTLLLCCCYLMSFIDTSVLYHLIKTQSTIKLYLFFNILEIADRLMSAFGQDTLDALFWTATEPGNRRRKQFGGVLFHMCVALAYVFLHASIVLLQALALNVAINADNKGLLTILISNNFVELKGAVFKKFDRVNLLQIACSDVRERFHLIMLMFVVALQTLKEYSWSAERLYILLPDFLFVFITEVSVDWIKHAFVTRFNEIPIEAYRDYTTILAHDLVTCKQKYADSDHSDLVARRMGFIPLPLAVVTIRILSQTLPVNNPAAVLLLAVTFGVVITFRVLNGIVLLGKACNILEEAEQRGKTRAEYDAVTDKSTAKKNTPIQSSSSTKAVRELKFPMNDALDKHALLQSVSHKPSAVTSIYPGDAVQDLELCGVSRITEMAADEEDGLEFVTPNKTCKFLGNNSFQDNSYRTVLKTKTALTRNSEASLATAETSETYQHFETGSSCSTAKAVDLQVSRLCDSPSPSVLYTTPFTTPTHLIKRVKGKRVRLDSGPIVQVIEPYSYLQVTESSEILNTLGLDDNLLPAQSGTSVDTSNEEAAKMKLSLDYKNTTVMSSGNITTPNSPDPYDSSASVSFCNDSQRGLLANSMVNLASVGLNQGPHSPGIGRRSSLLSSCGSLAAVDDEILSGDNDGEVQLTRPASCPSSEFSASVENVTHDFKPRRSSIGSTGENSFHITTTLGQIEVLTPGCTDVDSIEHKSDAVATIQRNETDKTVERAEDVSSGVPGRESQPTLERSFRSVSAPDVRLKNDSDDSEEMDEELYEEHFDSSER